MSRRTPLPRGHRAAGNGAAQPVAAGFTLLELIIVIVVVAALSGMLFQRVPGYQEMAEKAAMESTVGALQSALAIQVAGRISRGRIDELPTLAKLNPMTLLNGRQANYVGEFYEVPDDDIPPGSWYFDLKHRQLVYVVRNGAHFRGDQDGAKVVRFETVLVYSPGQGDDGAAAKKELGGVILKEVEPYSWAIR